MSTATGLLALARRVRTTIGGDRAWDAIRPVYWRAVSPVAGTAAYDLLGKPATHPGFEEIVFEPAHPCAS